MFCQLLAMANLLMIFYLTDLFLDGNFKTYGWDVIAYKSMSIENQNRSPDPMCNTFPSMVSCEMKKFGTGGNLEDINGYCLLAQNAINEKIYFFLWFWLIGLFILALLQIFLECCILILPFIRVFLICQGIGTGSLLNANMKEYLYQCSIGDWFVLYQISKNNHKEYFFRLLARLSDRVASAPPTENNCFSGLTLRNSNPKELATDEEVEALKS